MRKMAYNPPTVQMPVERTWALVEGDAVAVMPDWAIGGTEASKDALSSTRHRAWLAARRRASGTTLHPHATTITHCQHSLTSPMWSTTMGCFADCTDILRFEYIYSFLFTA